MDKIPWNKGIKGIYHHSEETRQKMREIAKKKWADEEYREKTLEKTRDTIREKGGYKSWNKGKHGVQDYSGNGQKISIARKGKKLSEEHRRNMGIAQKKLWANDSHREKMHKARLGHRVSDETKEKVTGERNPFYGKKHSPETRIVMSDLAKKHWRDETTAKKMIAGLHITPNRAERYLDSILNNNFPDEWKYVGDGQVIIGGLCPDFINVNGKKQIIELFGKHWHHGTHIKPHQTEEGRRKVFKEFGFDMIVIWGHELRESDKIIKRITEGFYGGRNKGN